MCGATVFDLIERNTFRYKSFWLSTFLEMKKKPSRVTDIIVVAVTQTDTFSFAYVNYVCTVFQVKGKILIIKKEDMKVYDNKRTEKCE
jgi:hypothetical protein